MKEIVVSREITRSAIYLVSFGQYGAVHAYRSLTALYAHHSPEVIGCTLRTLWGKHIDFGSPYENEMVKIERVALYGLKNTKK